MKFTVLHRIPTIDEYNQLRNLVGWPTFAPLLVKEALEHSLFAVCIQSDGMTVGMGRIVGDMPSIYTSRMLSSTRIFKEEALEN